ncbi:MAG: hypothetical protein FJX25_17275 [Alphaproteobacteria bacterium]|nr:hypothetical protein [Alphaproteobacteria bacterium]
MTIHHRAQPVMDRDGTIYPSQAAAARALGVRPGTIHYHIDTHGSLDMLGLSEGSPASWRGRMHRNAVDAAKAAGVNSSCAYYHLRTHGNLDRMGKGRSGVPGNRGQGKPITMGGHTWSSKSAMARDLQVKGRTLGNWLAPDASDIMRAKLRAALAGYSDRLMAERMAAQARTFAKVGK